MDEDLENLRKDLEKKLEDLKRDLEEEYEKFEEKLKDRSKGILNDFNKTSSEFVKEVISKVIGL